MRRFVPSWSQRLPPVYVFCFHFCRAAFLFCLPKMKFARRLAEGGSSMGFCANLMTLRMSCIFFFLPLCNKCASALSVIANLLRTLLGFFFLLLFFRCCFSLMLGWTPTLPFHSWTGIENNLLPKYSVPLIPQLFLAVSGQFVICSLDLELTSIIRATVEREAWGRCRWGRKKGVKWIQNDLVRQLACCRIGLEVRPIHLGKVQR